MDTTVNKSQQSSLAAKRGNGILGCIRKSVASRCKEVICPFHSALGSLHLKCWVWFWGPQRKREMGHLILKRAQQSATKINKGPEYLSYKERLRELKVFSLEKRKVRGIFSMCIKTQTNGEKGDGAGLFWVVSS